MKHSRGQVSTELLIIIGLLLLLLVPLLFYAYNRTNIAKEDIGVQKAEFAAQRMARLADAIGYMGGESRIVDEIQIPPHVTSISVRGNGHDIVFTMDSTTGTKEIVKSSAFKILLVGFDRGIREGNYWVDIQALSEPGPNDETVMMSLQ